MRTLLSIDPRTGDRDGVAHEHLDAAQPAERAAVLADRRGAVRLDRRRQYEVVRDHAAPAVALEHVRRAEREELAHDG